MKQEIEQQLGCEIPEDLYNAAITYMTYFRYESGERIPNVCIAQQLAKTLNTTIEELFPLSGANKNNQLNNNIRKEK